MNHLLSVIVPVYNVELYIERCIESIINQTYKNLEIILVNDGSKDDSGKICDLYAQKDSRIKVIHQINKGLSGARNSGMQYSTGDFIAYVDSDDWLELDMYNDLMNLINENNLEIIECDIQRTTHEKIEKNSKLLIENNEQAALRILENKSFSVFRRIYKKELIENIPFKENFVYEDMMFTSELLCKINNIGYFNKAYYNYFIENDTSIMHGPYSLKNVASIDAILIFDENIKKCFINESIIEVKNKQILYFSFDHYKKLFHNSHFDKNLAIRKKLKNLIDINYNSQNETSNYIKLARYSPIWFFKILSRFMN
jgi:glycosyltransferase involved in cell wall biosynthesis